MAMRLLICIPLLLSVGCAIHQPTRFNGGDIVDPPTGCQMLRGTHPAIADCYRACHLQLMREIFKQIRARFSYQTDLQQYGEVERWVMPTDTGPITGDCEDFALACRTLCRRAGLQTRLIICWTEDGASHAVLECDGWIFDVRQTDIVPRDALDYTWLFISGYQPGDPWRIVS